MAYLQYRRRDKIAGHGYIDNTPNSQETTAIDVQGHAKERLCQVLLDGTKKPRVMITRRIRVTQENFRLGAFPARYHGWIRQAQDTREVTSRHVDISFRWYPNMQVRHGDATHGDGLDPIRPKRILAVPVQVREILVRNQATGEFAFIESRESTCRLLGLISLSVEALEMFRGNPKRRGSCVDEQRDGLCAHGHLGDV